MLTRFGVCEHCLRDMNNLPLLAVCFVPDAVAVLSASHRLGDVVSVGESEDISGLYGEGLNNGK